MRKVILLVLLLVIGTTHAYAKDMDFDKWFNDYHKHPAPNKFVKAMKFVFEKEGYKHEEEDVNVALAVFFGQIMSDNPKKIDRWVKQIGKLDEEKERFLQNVLWFSGAESCKKHLKGEFKSKEPPNVLALEPNSAIILDMQWSYFFATGKKEPVRNIIKALNLLERGMSIEDFKKSKQTDEDQDKLFFRLTYEAARWSLGTNCRNHERVLKYCKEIYDSNKLTKSESLWLGTILAEVAPEEYSIKYDGQNRVTIIKQKADDYTILSSYISYLEQYIGGYPPKIDSDNQLKQIKDKLDKAMGLAESLNRKDPKNPDLLWALGFLNHMAHNIDIKGAAKKSINYFKKALAEDPKHIKSLLGLAGLYVSSNSEYFPEAEKLFLRAKKLAAPEPLPEADEGLMFAYIFKGDYKKAIEYCDLCLKAYPDSEKFKNIKAGIENGSIKRKFEPLKK